MLYLMWYDDSPKRTLADKIRAAAVAYEARFRIAPNVARINPADVPADGVACALPVELAITVQRNMVWVGLEAGQ